MQTDRVNKIEITWKNFIFSDHACENSSKKKREERIFQTKEMRENLKRGNHTHESEKIISNIFAFSCASKHAIDIDFLSSLHSQIG